MLPVQGYPRGHHSSKSIPSAPADTMSSQTGLWLSSFVTSVTGPGDTGSVIEYSTGRPARPTVSEPPPLADSMVSATSTLSESETESAGSATVSTVESDVANSVSAAANVRIETGLPTNPPERASSRPVRPVWFTVIVPVFVSMSVSATVSALSGKDQAIVAATGSPRPSSSRAWGVMVSYSSRLSGAVTSSAIVRLKSPGPNLPQASAAASTKTPPTQLPPL